MTDSLTVDELIAELQQIKSVYGGDVEVRYELREDGSTAIRRVCRGADSRAFVELRPH